MDDLSESPGVKKVRKFLNKKVPYLEWEETETYAGYTFYTSVESNGENPNPGLLLECYFSHDGEGEITHIEPNLCVGVGMRRELYEEVNKPTFEEFKENFEKYIHKIRDVIKELKNELNDSISVLEKVLGKK